jgi:hypothetical protein
MVAKFPDVTGKFKLPEDIDHAPKRAESTAKKRVTRYASPGRPLTEAQKKARRLIRANPDWSAGKIASMCGLTRDAVQKDAVYKLRRKQDDRPAKVAAGAALVEAGEANQRQAAQQMGVHESAISKFRTRQKLKQENEDGKNG